MDARKRILIVDDEQINLEFFDVMLTKLGFVVEKAENGVEALEKTKHFVPNLIILDNIMPRMSGWEVTKTLKNAEEYRDYRDIPIIMFSAMDDVKDKIEGFELGVDDYITKPYNFSEVLARIRAVLRNRELFVQIAARESRLELVEKLNEELGGFGEELLKGIDELIAAASAADHGPEKPLANLILSRTTAAKRKIEELESRIKAVSAAHAELKKREIELVTLERQYRKGLTQE